MRLFSICLYFLNISCTFCVLSPSQFSSLPWQAAPTYTYGTTSSPIIPSPPNVPVDSRTQHAFPHYTGSTTPRPTYLHRLEETLMAAEHAVVHSVSNGRSTIERTLHSVAHLLRSLATTVHVRLHDAVNRTELTLLKVEHALGKQLSDAEASTITFLEAPWTYIENLYQQTVHYIVFGLIIFSASAVGLLAFLYCYGSTHPTTALPVNMALVPRSLPPV